MGIYSAWAKVRTNRYFYSNMYLDDTNFRYLADPMTIFKGRMIAVGVFILFNIVTAMSPILGVILALLFVIAIPYLMNKSLAFGRRMTAYKNIQFRFHGSYGEAFMVLFVWPILGVITFGILYPMAFLKMHQYVIKNSAYGTTKFDFSATYKDYGMIFLIVIGLGIAVAIPVILINTMMPALILISPIIIAVAYIGAILYFMVSLNNLIFNNLSIVQNKFEGSMQMMELGKVLLINFLLTVVTLGLYLPAAKVRMVKYFASRLTLHAVVGLDSFAAAEKENVSALGEEMGDVFDLGF
ncbi:MAG: YjgN family protein [Enterobacterales bacterium]|nr:YjgN family protein [Enterobacterales bacterium]